MTVSFFRRMMTSVVVAGLFAALPAKAQNALKPWTQGGFETHRYRNVFAEMGYAPEEIDARLEGIFQEVFYGPDKVYFEVGDDMAYMSDVKNFDARTEGMSYGMMVAVQLDKKAEFDRLFRWAKKYMQYQDGPMKGYFAWSLAPDGTIRGRGPASDGELYFVTALIFAANRWGNDGEFNYLDEARFILDSSWEKDGSEGIKPFIDKENHLIVFTPDGRGTTYTDPSYHIPAFYEVWARWADDGRADFYRACAKASREYLHKSIDPVTGLNPDTNNFDGSFIEAPAFFGRRMKPAFRFDSWRVPMNIALDYSWACADRAWQTTYANTVQDFFCSKGIDTFADQYNVDGTEVEFAMPAGMGELRGTGTRHSVGLVSTLAAASLAADHPTARAFAQRLWDSKNEPYEDGYFDAYYDGLLRLFAFMHLSGHYRVIEPKDDIYPDGYEPESCTSIMVGRLASTDGSVFTSHTCDGVSHTWISMEPAADHKKGDVFEVYKGLRHTKFKGDTTGVRKVGEIPEVRHTYAYVNTGYPCLNEKQLAIGESTFTGPDTLINKDAMFLIEELARLALMRCDNARDAIRLMGETAGKYGYGDTGECLTVADKKEVWAFEIVGCGRDKVGAVWVAQRVPDDEVSISCNIPRIGRIDRKDKDHFMASDNVEAVAKEYGLWDGQGDFVWFKAYNVPRAQGKNYGIRDWFVFNELAPSLGLSMEDPELPFSVKPEHKVSAREVMKLLRGTYEGTPYDMCKDWKMVTAKGDTLVSPVANPWLVADTRNTLNTIAPGTVEFVRTLAVCWCSYSTVLQLRSWLPDALGGILWYGVDNPAESPRIPIFAGGTSLPAAFDNCGQKQYVPDCILWTFRRPNRLGTVAWQKNKDDFEKLILEMEDMAFEGLPVLENNPSPAALNAYTAQIYEQAARRWSDLEEKLWIKHGRGF